MNGLEITEIQPLTRGMRARCRDCNKLFHKPPSHKYVRCPTCRMGKVGIADSTRVNRRVCPLCGGMKSHRAQKCRKCTTLLLQGRATPDMIMKVLHPPSPQLVSAVADQRVEAETPADAPPDVTMEESLEWLRNKLRT